MSSDRSVLRTRWLGTVAYREAHALQSALHRRSREEHLLLLQHPHVYTLGTRADLDHLLVHPSEVGAELVDTDRGGDVTYHGPGQLVGYPVITLPEWRGGKADVVAYVRALEGVLVGALGDFGIVAWRRDGYTGVWVGEEPAAEKIAAIGVKVTRGRTMHGFALNVDPDLAMFEHIVPCGIRDRGVTSMRRVLGDEVRMQDVTDRVADRFAERFGYERAERQDVVWRERRSDLSAFSRGATRRRSATELEPVAPRRGGPACGPAAGGGSRPPAEEGTPVRLLGRLAEAGVDSDGHPDFSRPDWMRVRAELGPRYRELKRLMRGLDLHTVCEEAGCPNIYECWSDRTATFMILGERCTRACGFCLVDTRRPEAVDTDEPERVADAVEHLGLEHAVVTSVARDDLPDGGASIFAETIRAVRRRSPATAVEVLIPDCKGDPEALAAIVEARPDVLNHNIETVARLQRAVRPSAGYARSLTVLARAKDAGLTTKSGLIVGMGESEEEVHGTLVDLRAVGVDVVTIGQYLRPTAEHVPVVRWWRPEEFRALADFGDRLGFAHVEAGPLVRSSYHAKQASASAGGTPVAVASA